MFITRIFPWKGVRRLVQTLMDTLNELVIHVKAVAKNTDPANQTQQPQRPPTVNVVLDLPLAAARYYDAENEDRNNSHWWKLANFIVSLLTLIALVWYACTTHSQYNAMLDSNDINRSTLESVQRAFISFQHFEYFRIQDADHVDVHNWNVLADFENNGTTPASHVIGFLNIGQLPAEPTEQEFRGNERNFPAIGLSPKAVRAVPIGHMIPEPLLFGIDLGPGVEPKIGKTTHLNHNIFIWGWVCYRDIFFPKTHPHLTELCVQLTGVNYIPAPAVHLMFNFGGCASHDSCEDSDCKDYQQMIELDR